MARNVRSGSRLDTVLFAVCGAFSLVFAGVLPGNLREAFAAGLRRTVVAPLVSLQRRAELSRSAFLTHDQITAQRDSAAVRTLSVVGLETENERLRRLLGLGAQLRWGFVPAEAIHSAEARGHATGEEFTVTLTAGSDAGVRPFSPVVAPEGLVGMVQTVDPTMSLAITWANPDFRVSAMTADGSAFGIVQAHLGGGPNSPERYLLEMRGVPFRSALQPGTLIVSSGYGGVYPEGVPVGTILGEIKTSETWARTYLLRPAVSPPQISSVMIIQPQRTKAGVKNVWTSLAAVDSATRRVASAGDSLARSSAMAELAARRAALDSSAAPRDSTRRDSTRRAPVAPPVTTPRVAPTTSSSPPAAGAPPAASPPAAPRPSAPRPPRPVDSARTRPSAPRPDSAPRVPTQPDTTHPAAGGPR